MKFNNFVLNKHTKGYWSEWSKWTPCDSNCGLGNRERERKCIDGTPEQHGCLINITKENEYCQVEPCGKFW